MTNKKIYGPWIKWDGGECPVSPDTRVKVKFRCGVPESEDRAGDYFWNHAGDGLDTVGYCTVTEQPDLDAAQNLLTAFGYTVTPPAKPLTFEGVTPMTEAPPNGTRYWTIQPFNSRGVEDFAWGGDEYDLAALRHRMAYLNQEHALIAAQYIFGLKGGEL